MFDHPRLVEVKIKCQESKGTTVLKRVFQWTINLLPLMSLFTMIYVTRSLISHWFLLFWSFNNIEMTKNLEVNYGYSFFFFLNRNLLFPQLSGTFFLLFWNYLSQYFPKSEIKKKDEKPKFHDFLKLPVFLEKGSRNLFLFQFT